MIEILIMMKLKVFFLQIDKLKELLKDKIKTQYVYEALQMSSNCYVERISKIESI
jgi:hypothetical protein